eukprot:scaffold462_cov195-Pinguiococcus_pyrenoidosus.AAC.68
MAPNHRSAELRRSPKGYLKRNSSRSDTTRHERSRDRDTERKNERTHRDEVRNGRTDANCALTATHWESSTFHFCSRFRIHIDMGSFRTCGNRSSASIPWVHAGVGRPDMTSLVMNLERRPVDQ